ncbi:MAG: hypothetical protein KC912_02275 [Proteobacteria bacterium]|nr:hypothetical protein [Pseudomonadota bacterium]
MRSHIEDRPNARLSWRSRSGNEPVGFRNHKGRTDYNYVTGTSGSLREFCDAIFERQEDVYTHVGQVSSGFVGLKRHPWGEAFFTRLRAEILVDDWFQIPDWELPGHAFIGHNRENWGDPRHGAPGSDWHMFPSANLFVMLAGEKRWMTRPPQSGDQLTHLDEVIHPSGGREAPHGSHAFDTVQVLPGDVLFNPPYEWHKVLNARGVSLGVAMRIVDRAYVSALAGSAPMRAHVGGSGVLGPDGAHLLTSLRMASRDPVRAAMCLNAVEFMVCRAARFGALGP